MQHDYHQIYHRAIKFYSLLMEMTRFIYNVVIEYNFMTLAVILRWSTIGIPTAEIVTFYEKFISRRIW